MHPACIYSETLSPPLLCCIGFWINTLSLLALVFYFSCQHFTFLSDFVFVCHVSSISLLKQLFHSTAYTPVIFLCSGCQVLELIDAKMLHLASSLNLSLMFNKPCLSEKGYNNWRVEGSYVQTSTRTKYLTLPLC